MGLAFLVTVVFMGAIAWRVAATRRSRERHRWFYVGRCLGCGYDLRGSGNRCPECGRWIWG